MFPYVLSPDVLQDLQDIWDFIGSDNARAADKQEDEFFEAFEMLARRPPWDMPDPISPSGTCDSGQSVNT
jgi:plasmid stabilization system protein ParE